MSTHCAIFYKDQEGKCNGIFCHFNGMPDTTGDILYQNYQNEELVQQLIDLGGLLFIEEHIREIVTFKSALIYLYDATKKEQNKWTIFYHGKTTLCHRKLTPSLIKKLSD